MILQQIAEVDAALTLVADFCKAVFPTNLTLKRLSQVTWFSPAFSYRSFCSQKVNRKFVCLLAVYGCSSSSYHVKMRYFWLIDWNVQYTLLSGKYSSLIIHILHQRIEESWKQNSGRSACRNSLPPFCPSWQCHPCDYDRFICPQPQMLRRRLRNN